MIRLSEDQWREAHRRFFDASFEIQSALEAIAFRDEARLFEAVEALKQALTAPFIEAARLTTEVSKPAEVEAT